MSTNTIENTGPVLAGEDRHEKPGLMIWGRIPLATKVSTAETGGLFYSFEHREMAKGGPPRHVHHEQDEWFYVIKGRYVFEVGDDRFELKAGDSLFAPRGIPHAWACVSDEPGTVLTTVSPAGTFERFILETTEHAGLPSPEEIAKAFEASGMSVLGPPLDV
jgi:quercetin dioxygenase-like cupin family protein